jgi:cyclic pyranopterin phosphate synthase
MGALSHVTGDGSVRMVDVSTKKQSTRIAVATGCIYMSPETMSELLATANPKGDVLATARIAAIQAAKKCHELIPLCHALSLDSVEIDLDADSGASRVVIRSRCVAHAVTGVEMEALTAVSVAALTIYDMCKAMDKGMVIGELRLLSKSGGSSGDWERPAGT